MFVRALMQTCSSNSSPMWRRSAPAHRAFSSLLCPPQSQLWMRSSRLRAAQTPLLPVCSYSAPVRLLPRSAPRLQTAGNLRCRIVRAAASRDVLHEFEVISCSGAAHV